ncbi:MAG: hypothetical protein ACREOO_19255 [bacterium]
MALLKQFYSRSDEEKLGRENIQGKDNANMTHRQVGVKVRQTMKGLDGTMPEELLVKEPHAEFRKDPQRSVRLSRLLAKN